MALKNGKLNLSGGKSAQQVPTAAVLIIGDEILSGRTKDENIAYLAGGLLEIGIRVKEVRVIPDDQQVIIDAVRYAHETFDYVFTTGGIGPTHDDITAASIAVAFGVPVERHPEALKRLEDHYGDQINESRRHMADIPKGATLIDNPSSRAPGFKIENVYVLAGVPSIMRAMFDALKYTLRPGPKVWVASYESSLVESLIAADLAQIQAAHSDVEIGSYPFFKAGQHGVVVVLRTLEHQSLNQAGEEVMSMIERQNGTLISKTVPKD